jgi:anaphase-promoting complex subunit 1
VHYLDQFTRITKIAPTTRLSVEDHPSYDEELARSAARMCQDIVAVSAAIVMAGTGDLIVLRRLRALHGRDDVETPYGSHLAAHLAIGALFLGCGTKTFGTSNLAIASLLIAFYPLFPISVMDNRSHLQAFRHFWVLATEDRCLVVKDVSTGQPLNIPVYIRLKPEIGSVNGAVLDGREVSAEKEDLHRTTPCLLPPLSEIASIRTAASPAYWDIELDLTANPSMAASLRDSQTLFLRRRPAQEAPFASTLRALGGRASTPAGSTVGRDPLEWIFGLGALAGLTYGERALVLDAEAGGGGDGGRSSGACSVVDVRLELERAVNGMSMDGLMGLRLLFEWAAKRTRLVSLPPHGADKRKGKENGHGHEQGRGKLKKKGKEKVKAVESDAYDDAEDLVEPDDPAATPAEWWMRDSVVETLKGRVWLAGRGHTRGL